MFKMVNNYTTIMILDTYIIEIWGEFVLYSLEIFLQVIRHVLYNFARDNIHNYYLGAHQIK